MLPQERSTKFPTLPSFSQGEDDFFLVSPLSVRLPLSETRPSAVRSYRYSGLANPFPFTMDRSRSPDRVAEFISIESSHLLPDIPIFHGALVPSTLSEPEPTGDDHHSPQCPPPPLYLPTTGTREDKDDQEETETAASMECESKVVTTGSLRRWRLHSPLVPTGLSSPLTACLRNAQPFGGCCYTADSEVFVSPAFVPIIDGKHIMGIDAQGTYGKDGNDEARLTTSNALIVEDSLTTTERESSQCPRRLLRFRPSGQNDLLLSGTSMNYLPSRVFRCFESDEMPASPLLDQLMLPSC